MTLFAELAAIAEITSFVLNSYKVYRNVFYPQKELTLDDVIREISSSNAQFFQGEHISILQKQINTFYRWTKPSIIEVERITKTDLLAGGRLHDIYEHLRVSRGEVNIHLQGLDWLHCNSELHPDDLINLTRILTEAYVVLLHMQFVFSQLHYIEMGCNSLDHPNLGPDTLQTLFYLEYAIDAVSRIHKRTKARRLGMIRMTTAPYGLKDTYKPLGNPTQKYRLLHMKPTTPQPENHPHPEAWWDTQHPISRFRFVTKKKACWALRVLTGQVCYMFDLLGGDSALEVIASWKHLKRLMEDRFIQQNYDRTLLGFVSRFLCPANKRELLPSSEQMLHRRLEELLDDKEFQGESVKAVYDTSIVRIEWVQIDGPSYQRAENGARRKRSVKVRTFVEWDDGHVHHQSNKMGNFPRSIIPELNLRFGKVSQDFKTFEEGETSMVGTQHVTKSYVYHRVYTLKTYLWFCLFPGRGPTKGSALQSAFILSESEVPIVRKIEWELHSNEILESDAKIMGRETVDVRAEESNCLCLAICGGGNNNIEEISLQRSSYKRRDLKQCRMIIKERLVEEYGILAKR